MINATVLITGAMAVIGAVIGESQVLCLNGQCLMTGTWIGGSLVGGAFGYLAAGILLPWKTSKPANPDDAEPGNEEI